MIITGSHVEKVAFEGFLFREGRYYFKEQVFNKYEVEKILIFLLF